jgi:dimethylamine/trimethylamine dehydrogenase
MQYYEEEIAGESYFEGLAGKFSNPLQKLKMQLLAQVETHAAAAIAPLLEQYGLTPKSCTELHKSGYQQASEVANDWDELLAEMRETFPGYFADFERLEALAPPQDRARLKMLSAHEVAAIKFLDAEAKSNPNSASFLWQYLRSGAA